MDSMQIPITQPCILSTGRSPWDDARIEGNHNGVVDLLYYVPSRQGSEGIAEYPRLTQGGIYYFFEDFRAETRYLEFLSRIIVSSTQ